MNYGDSCNRRLKGPTTTKVPDWERLFDQLLERQARVMRIVSAVRAIGGDPSELMYDLEGLGLRLKYIDQMRRVTVHGKLPHAA